MTLAPVDRLRELLEEAGYGFVEPPLLHDADLFLDLAGEDLRRRMFLTATNDGVDLCLRPDYTIPVAVHHLTTGDPARVAAYAYHGPVFRQRPGETGEFHQAGIESIGRGDITEADADTLALALKAVALFDIEAPMIRIGDSALFVALLDALPLSDVWRRRLARSFGDNALLAAQLDELAGKTSRPRPTLPGLGSADRDEAESTVAELLAMANVSQAGGRTAAEIADRFLEQQALSTGSDDDIHAVEVIRRFLAISGTPDDAALALGELAAEEAPTLIDSPVPPILAAASIITPASFSNSAIRAAPTSSRLPAAGDTTACCR
jgi:ATP phosphoribosyltransferase regulatory subunit